MNIVAEHIRFFNQTIPLAGTLYLPDGVGPHPVLLVLHAATGGLRRYPFYQHLYQQLPLHGIAVFLYDRRGSGESGGDFETAGFEALAEDAAAALDYLRSCSDVDQRRIGVYGISQGGWIAPIVAARATASVAFLVIVSGCGVSPAGQMNYASERALRSAGFSEEAVTQAIALRNHVNRYYRGDLPRQIVQTEIDHAVAEPWFQVAYLGGDETLPEDVTREKWYYELDYDPLPIWQHVEQPVLFIFAEDDRFVDVPQSMSRFKTATAHLAVVTMLRIAGTEHLMNELGDLEMGHVSVSYVDRLIDWLVQRTKKERDERTSF